MRRIVRWCAAMGAALALALVGLTMPASAADGFLKAPGTEFCFYPPATGADVTLSWDTGNDKPGKLKRIVNGNELYDEVDAVGSKTYLLGPYGYEFILFDSDVKVVASIKVNVKECPPVPPCAAGCFKEVKITPNGMSADIEVTTKVPTRLKLEADTVSPGNNQFPQEALPLDSTAESSTLQNNHTVRLTNLKAATIYNVLIFAEGADGSSPVPYGKWFETKHRKLEVTIDKITVWDDSDDHSNGDLGFTFRIRGIDHFWPENDPGEDWFESDTTEPVGKTFVADDVSETVKIQVFGYDEEDEGAFAPSCPAPWYINCHDPDMGEATQTFDLVGDPEEFTGSLYYKDVGDSLEFSVFGSFKVTYV